MRGRGFLHTLARHLRGPEVTADLADGDSLIVAAGDRKLEVEVHTETDPKRSITIVYRNVQSGDEYGSIAEVEAAAAAILRELGGERDGG